MPEGDHWKVTVTQRPRSTHGSPTTAHDANPATLGTFWNYNAQLLTVQIKRDGQDVTGPKDSRTTVLDFVGRYKVVVFKKFCRVSTEL